MLICQKSYFQNLELSYIFLICNFQHLLFFSSTTKQLHFRNYKIQFKQFGTEPPFRSSLLLGEPPSRGLLSCFRRRRIVFIGHFVVRLVVSIEDTYPKGGFQGQGGMGGMDPATTMQMLQNPMIQQMVRKSYHTQFHD